MIPTHALSLTTTKSITAHLLPGALLVMGGLLGWKLWQQHKKSQLDEEIQTELSRQLDQVQSQLAEIKKQQSEQSSAQKVKPRAPTFQTSQTDDDTIKHALFEKLKNENIAFRKAH